MGEKTGDAEVKANLQPSFYVREIDSRCPKGYCLLAKKDKENTYWVPRDETFNKDKNKAKPHNFSSSANQPQTQDLKKNKRGCRGGHLATAVNAIKVAKKDEDKAKDLNHL